MIINSCAVTNDFKVVDALRPGMLPIVVHDTVSSYRFVIKDSLRRPTSGWPAERADFIALGWRAGQQEATTGKPVSRVEYYPVGHGLFGYGLLFLFYGEDGRLLTLYRTQIN